MLKTSGLLLIHSPIILRLIPLIPLLLSIVRGSNQDFVFQLEIRSKEFLTLEL